MSHGELDIYAKYLSLKDARMLVKDLTGSKVLTSWKAWSGKGGQKITFNTIPITRNELGKLVLPEHVTGINIERNREIWPTKEGYVRLSLMGGDDWKPPEYGDETAIGIRFVEQSIHYPISIRASIQGGGRFFKNLPANQFCEITIREWPWGEEQWDFLRPVDREDQGEFNRAGCVEVLDNFQNRLMELIPAEHVLPDEDQHPISRQWRYPLEMSREVIEAFHELVGPMVNRSPESYYKSYAFASIGGQASFQGESVDATADAKHLVKCVLEHNNLPIYQYYYSYLGNRTWRDREKLRKKRKVTYEELGTATFTKGGSMVLHLTYGPEGYDLRLEFPDQDSHNIFFESRLFKKWDWISAAQ